MKIRISVILISCLLGCLHYGLGDEPKVLALLEKRCASCHNDDEYPDLHGKTDLAALHGESDTVEEIVNRINLPHSSKRRMPRSRGAKGDDSYLPPLTKDEIKTLEDWAKSGAPSTKPAAPSKDESEESKAKAGHNPFCPIDTSQPIDPDLHLEYAGKTVYFCCNRCKDLFEIHANYVIKARGPERMPQFAGMEGKLGLDTVQLLPQRFCPIEDGMLILPGNPSVDYQGKKIYLSDEFALKDWKSDPEKYATAGISAGVLIQLGGKPLPEVRPDTKVAAALPNDAIPAGGDLETRARHILDRNCAECHTPKVRSDPNFRLTLDQILAQGIDKAMLRRVTRKPGDDGFMPKGEDPLTTEELNTLKDWFDSGIESQAKREPLLFSQMVRHIYNDVRSNETAAKHYRYLTLTNLYNATDAEGYALHDDAQLDNYRAAISKLINSLSMQGKISVPVAIDTQKTIYRIDTQYPMRIKFRDALPFLMAPLVVT